MLWKISRSLQKDIFPSKKNVFIRRENIGRIQAWREKSKNDSLLLISSNHDPSCCRNFDRRGDDEPWFEAGRREKTPCNRTSAIKSDFIPSNRNRSSLDSFWSLRATPLRVPSCPHPSSNLSGVVRANDLGETIGPRGRLKEKKGEKNSFSNVILKRDAFPRFSVNIELLLPCTTLYEIK